MASMLHAQRLDPCKSMSLLALRSKPAWINCSEVPTILEILDSNFTSEYVHVGRSLQLLQVFKPDTRCREKEIVTMILCPPSCRPSHGSGGRPDPWL